MSLEAGIHLGPYEIVGSIGAGGMGEVYLARDARLKRDVAIKVLPERLAKDTEALNRFEREAQAVAALSHPNILAIYDVGADPPASPLAKGGKRGVSYVVTELLEGETLRERVRRSAIPWRKAVDIATAIADGLAAAHAKGIIHRDLKPENIFLTNDGVVKILDFGLAHVEPATSGASATGQADTPTVTLNTRPGTILGTINYMSPEQVRGQRTDARSDIFQLGCVLYEMVSGRRAFTGDSPPETMTAILKDHPPDTTESGVKTVPELDRVIRRCLEKKSDQRIHSARDLGFALRDILSDSGAAKPLPAGAIVWTGKAVWIAVGAVVVMSAVLAYVLQWGGAGVQPTEAIDSLAIKSKTGRINLVVLPFKDISPAPEAWFGDGLTETLIAQLSRLSPDRLSVIASTTAMQYKGSDKRVRQIGRELNIDYLVEGRVQRIDDRVRIFAKLVRVSDETHVWSEDFDRQIDDVFALQSDVVSRIAEGIQIQLTPTQEAQLARARPVDPDALDAYLQGIALAKDGTQQACRSALKMFDQAIEIDPSFALAHVGRANVFLTLGEWHVPPMEAMPHAKTAALDALALDEGLPEALTALAYVQMEFEWDFHAAEETFKRAMKLNSSSTDARLGYAQYLTVMKRGDEAIRQLDWVRKHDPASVYTYEHHGMVAFMARRFDRVIRVCSAAIEVDQEFWKARSWLGLAHAQRGQFSEGVHHLRKALSQSDNSPVVAAMLGSVLAVSGEPEEARVIVERLKERERSNYVCPYELATVWIGLEDYDEAFAEMDRACDGRALCMPWLQVDPRLDPIRSDPRFDPLVRRVDFEQDDKP